MRRLTHPVRLAVLLCGAVLVAAGVAASAAAAPPTFGTGPQAIHEQRDDSEGDNGAQKTCTPISVETTDYLLDVVSTLPNYFGLPAKIDIHTACDPSIRTMHAATNGAPATRRSSCTVGHSTPVGSTSSTRTTA